LSFATVAVRWRAASPGDADWKCLWMSSILALAESQSGLSLAQHRSSITTGHLHLEVPVEEDHLRRDQLHQKTKRRSLIAHLNHDPV
jgi:hypothetical protein